MAHGNLGDIEIFLCAKDFLSHDDLTVCGADAARPRAASARLGAEWNAGGHER